MLSLFLNAQGIEFTAINDGKQALEAIRNEDANLVLLDLAMPDFSGLDIVNHLRKEKLIESKNIVLFTASSMSDDLIEEMKNAGIKDILKKPVDIDELQYMIIKFRPA